MNTNDDKKAVAFIHVPKTAGTSLTALLAEHYRLAPPYYGTPSYFAEIVASGQFELFAGHFLYCDLREYLPSATYLTFVREPISRCYSLYRSMHKVSNFSDAWRRAATPEQASAVEFFQNRSFEDTIFCDDPYVVGHYRNRQVVHLADPVLPTVAGLDSAIRNAEQSFAFFGVFESMQLSLDMLVTALGIRYRTPKPLARLNVSTVEKPTLSARGMARLRDFVELDLALYDALLPTFAKRAAAHVRRTYLTATPAMGDDSPREGTVVALDSQHTSKGTLARGAETDQEFQTEGWPRTPLTTAYWRALDDIYTSTRFDRTIRCIVCGYEAQSASFEMMVDQCRFGGGILERYRCAKCDCIFGPQKYLDLDEQLLWEDSEVLWRWYRDNCAPHAAVEAFEALPPNLERLYLSWFSGDALDATIPTLRSKGWNVWGYEPRFNVDSAFVARRRGGISARFDGIFSCRFIEHLREPVSQFLEFWQILKDDGRMAHSTACYGERWATSRFHTLFLEGNSADVLAAKAGFKVLERSRQDNHTTLVFERVSAPTG